ncbi:MAG TPA: single-stranded-DNA-specific exonuclease RecJ [Clostridia bacterium]
MNSIFKKRDEQPVSVHFNNFNLKLSKTVLEILSARGLQSEQQIRQFLNPTEKDLYDPFLLSGMRELTSRLQEACQNNETIVIYGDYDADGICATAILSDYLASCGAQVYPYIPSRNNDGYGLSVDALTKIIEDCTPDLIVSCDCGISATSEVEFVMDLGVDIYITDHHEVPENPPSCVIINPKLKNQEYPFDMLCGAGVALKVVQAMGGISAASKYYDLCALATVADLVPLIDENRTLVVLGLKKINSSSVNLGLKMLCQYLGLTEQITSSDIAFRISPRINAAGRMGDAYRAFELLTEKDKSKILELIEEISADNERRRDICQELHNQALAMLSSEDLVNEYAIILHSSEWEKGLTSIVAAQISGEYHRPTFLMVEVNDSYKGTARSIEGINLYELLSEMSDIMIEFGGHAQAAGFSIYKDNLEIFKKRVNKYIKEKYQKNLFLPYSVYDMEIDESVIDAKLIKELDLLEPYGLGNPRPVFKLTAKSLSADFMKNKYNHVIAKTPEENTIVCFGYGKFVELMNACSDFELAVELSINKYKNKEYPTMVLKDINFSYIKSIKDNDKLHAQALKTLSLNGKHIPKYDIINQDQLNGLINNDRLYGTLILSYDFDSYKQLQESNLLAPNFVHNYIYSTTCNNYNRIILGCDFDVDFGGFDTIIFLEKPISDNVISYINDLTDAKVYVVDKELSSSIFDGLTTERAVFVRAYTILQKCEIEKDNFFSVFEQYVNDGIITYKQLMLCLVVFLELGILDVKWQDFCINPVQGVKTDLSKSEILRKIEKLISR